jgi:signal transduction protein with GAF and PtsI domain
LKERLEEFLKQFEADCGTIHLMGSDGVLYLVAASGIPEAVLQLVQAVPVGKGMAGLAAERKEAVNVCNLQTDTSGDAKPGAKAAGVQASIAVPMLVEGRVTGVIGVARRDERAFTDEDVAKMMVAAGKVRVEGVGE